MIHEGSENGNEVTLLRLKANKSREFICYETLIMPVYGMRIVCEKGKHLFYIGDNHMRIRSISLFLSIGICLLFTACSTGVYVKMHSTAPEWGPVFIGMKRSEAERHLGTPMFISPLGENQYRGIYEYPSEPSAKETLSFDVMDFTTLGLGTLLISPVDRFKKSRHLIAVVYQMEDKIVNNDRVIDIKEKVKVSMNQ